MMPNDGGIGPPDARRGGGAVGPHRPQTLSLTKERTNSGNRGRTQPSAAPSRLQ